MDFRRENGFSNGNVVQILSGNPGNGMDESWGVGSTDDVVWATEDDYGMWNNEDINSNSNHEGRMSQSRSGSEPPNKRSRNSQSGDLTASNRSKAIGKMFYKTKLCCKFRVGTCPYISNCNFAHSIEELRKPPPNWQDIVAAHEEDRGVSSEPREEFQIPILGVSDETQRSYKGRHCKKYYTEEGCPYGENCTFLHDEQSKAREKLHQYGGGPLDSDGKDSSTPDAKQGAIPAKTSMDTVVPSHASLPHSDGYHIGVPSQRLSNVTQKTGQRATQKWKGPDKISKIYGDWIDDL
ncbi:hypothetical protein DH2020_023159 [Rehmannia glutinosa]|uniref:C3H1-type domain-containing protein n=1 Tax=Rehmannia glutinosa TaxID=99300 RepID=A0ABR0W7T7_REHGL